MTIREKYFETIKKFIPRPEIRSSVGLDIGRTSCKLIELMKKGDGCEVLTWAVEPIVGGDVQQSIRTILTKLSQPCLSPTTAVLGKGTLIRYIDMPKMNLADLKKSFAFEADKYFPFPSDQIYTDCYILAPKEKENKITVLVAAVKKDIIDERIRLLTELNLQADFIGLNATALANVVHTLGSGNGQGTDAQAPAAEPAEKDVVAILDIGEAVSNLTIMIGELPWFTRDIFIGGREFTRSISNALGISLEEAEAMKLAPGDKLQSVVDASDSALSNLVSELRLSCDYFVTEKNLPVPKILLTGGASRLPGLEEHLEKSLELKVQRWDPFDAVTVGGQVSAEDLHKNADRLTAALGLALY